MIIEFFELFDDSFVIQEFKRSQQIFIPILKRTGWVPGVEEVIVRKLRRDRCKDLADVTGFLAA